MQAIKISKQDYNNFLDFTKIKRKVEDISLFEIFNEPFTDGKYNLYFHKKENLCDYDNAHFCSDKWIGEIDGKPLLIEVLADEEEHFFKKNDYSLLIFYSNTVYSPQDEALQVIENILRDFLSKLPQKTKELRKLVENYDTKQCAKVFCLED